MRNTKEIEQKATIIVSIDCDRCGKNVKVENGVPIEDMLMLQKIWSPESHWPDEQHTIEICQDCYEEIINHFNIDMERVKVRSITIQ